jgi:hypothetical protein
LNFFTWPWSETDNYNRNNKVSQHGYGSKDVGVGNWFYFVKIESPPHYWIPLLHEKERKLAIKKYKNSEEMLLCHFILLFWCLYSSYGLYKNEGSTNNIY